MPRKPKMPKYSGLSMVDGKIEGPVYAITMDIVPKKFGISNDATNAEMVKGVADHINGLIEKAREAARAEGEAAGYRRAINDACAVLDARYDKIAERGTEGPYDDGKLIALDLAEQAVRKLAPVEPVSKADELPAGAKGGPQ